MIDILSNPSYFLPPLIGAAITLGLIIIAMLWSRRDFSTLVFCGFLASIIFFNLVIFFMRGSPDVSGALFWEKVLGVPSLAMFLFYYHFTLIYSNNRGQRSILRFFYVLLVLVAVISPTDILVSDMMVESYGYAPVIAPAGYALYACGPLLLFMGARNLLKTYRASPWREEKRRLILLIIGIIFPLVGLTLDSTTNLPPMSIWGNLMLSIVCTVAILKYNLIEIRIVVRKSLVYFLVSAAVAIPYVGGFYLFFNIFQSRIIPLWLHIIVLFLLAIVLRPLYGWAQNLVDKLFYRDRYDHLRSLEQFSRDARDITNIDELGSKIVRLIGSALRSTSACLLLPSRSQQDFVAKYYTGLDNDITGVVLPESNPVVRWLHQHKEILSYEQFDSIPELGSAGIQKENVIARLRASVFIPIMTRENKLAGILVLGQKLSQQSYSIEDKQLLASLANQLAMALDNAQLYSNTLQARTNLEIWLNSIPDCVLIVSTDNKIQFMNKTALERFGSHIGDSCVTIFPGEESYLVQDYMEGRRDAVNYSESIEGRDYDIAAAPISHVDSSLSVIMVLRDITERKRAEEAQRESENRYRLLAENVTDLVLILDIDTRRPTYVSPSVTAILGYSVEEALSLSPEEILTPTALRITGEDLQKALAVERSGQAKSQVSRSIEFEMIAKDGTTVPIEARLSPLRDANGQPLAFLVVARDISERKRAEIEREALEQKAQLASRLATVGEMAAGIAHEINNPLTSVIGYAHSLMQKDLPDDIKRRASLIDEGAQRVAGIIRRMLAFARQQKPQQTYLNVNDVIVNTLELRAYSMKNNNISVTTTLDPDLPWTMVDASQLQQVFLNIIINAETEMKLAHGRGNLLIKSEQIDDIIRISFQDDGPGIAEEHLARIFDPFFTTREVGQGTGLGLSICHGIVSEHNGIIYAHSEKGKGATFVIELPIIASPKIPVESVIFTAETTDSKKNYRILVVDDEESILQLLRDELTDCGYGVDTVNNAADAINKIEASEYSLIIIDVKLPVTSGIEFYNIMKETDPAILSKLIFITGDVMAGDTQSFLAMAKVPYINKPFDPDQLEEVINRVLKRNSTE
jgi:PAS domain S-box-containing protein